ncbi:hypothetical protein BDV96DRAFT_561796 [Lophiotrema nucula]|uniref:C2H2-type domain-containing protein n=1 Tax=Lophiotrema nucula TaxID=690887 RepID=A0A6A5ZUM5_9PLEO|nr:hypothetical protein BDV96DRAFT_561796 [Lophiotrema nucula]
MYASDIASNSLYDGYVDSTAYEYFTTDILAFESFETSSSSYALPQSDQHIAPTITPNPLHGQHVRPSTIEYDARSVYLWELDGMGPELHTAFGQRHIEEASAGGDMLGPSKTLVSENIDDDICVIYEGALGSDMGAINAPSGNGEDDFSWALLDQDPTPVTPRPLSDTITERRPFECQYCKQGFRYPHDRTRHLRTVHNKQGNGGGYRCAVVGCMKKDKIWFRLDNFQQHLSRQHGIENKPRLIEKSRRLGSGNTFTVTTPDTFAQ